MLLLLSVPPLHGHQNEWEIFDENLAHIRTWVYQTQITLDESGKLSSPDRERLLKVLRNQWIDCGDKLLKRIHLSIALD